VTIHSWAEKFDRDRHPDAHLEPLPPTSWTEVDITAIVDGLVARDLERPTPTIGRRADGACLFYPGRVNSVFGESGDGKSWFALTVGAQEIAAGHAVVWVDFEDHEISVVGRLLDLGAEPDHIKAWFHYISPSEPFSPDAEAEVKYLVLQHTPTLVVIDSAGESMAVDGVGGNNDDEVARWTRRVPRFIADLGPGVILIDHVPKVTGRDKLFAIGSQRKRAAVSGLAVLVEIIAEFGIDREGRSKITVAKDRCGHYVRGTRVAEFALDATGAGCIATLEEPTVSTDSAGNFRPTTLMESVSRYVELNPGATQTTIFAAVRGKKDYVVLAIGILISEEYIVTELGPRRSTLHRVVRPFREATEDGE